jgi:hypothetical protein
MRSRREEESTETLADHGHLVEEDLDAENLTKGREQCEEIAIAVVSRKVINEQVGAGRA